MAGLVTPEVMIPGSPRDIAASVTLARRYARHVEQDARPLVRMCRDLHEVQAWESYFEDGEKSWERLCREALGYEPEFLAEIEQGVKILEQEGHVGDIPGTMAVQARARQAVRLVEHGGVGRGRNRGDSITSISKERGTSADYLASRIARDRPEVLERMKAGEFSSVRAAAREAGLVKERWSVPAWSIDRMATYLRERLTPEQLAALIEALS
jgi:hypothetical protein